MISNNYSQSQCYSKGRTNLKANNSPTFCAIKFEKIPRSQCEKAVDLKDKLADFIMEHPELEAKIDVVLTKLKEITDKARVHFYIYGISDTDLQSIYNK